MLVVGGLSGCRGDEPSERPDDGPVIALTGEAAVWPAALVKGRLAEQEGCLLIGDAVAVFPMGTGWDPPTVTFRDGEPVEVDSRVRMGGGTMDIDELTVEGSPLVPVAEVRECGRRTGADEYVWAAPRG